MASLIPKVKTALHELQKMTPPPGVPSGQKPPAGRRLPCCCCCWPRPPRAPIPPPPRSTRPTSFTRKANYASAAAAYEKMTQTGPVSAAVYFNLGNAWFKAGQIGRAICAYRRARELAPRDPDVRANLQFARSQPGLGAPALPGTRWTRWVSLLTLNEWTGLASAFVALFFIVLTARQIWPAWKKSGAGLAVALAAACAGVAGLSGPGAGRPLRSAVRGGYCAGSRGAAQSLGRGCQRLHRARRRGTAGVGQHRRLAGSRRRRQPQRLGPAK